MTFRRAKENTHQACRSLLQKAVRRGDDVLASKVIDHLAHIGDKSWLRQRCVVITAEECWPLLNNYLYSPDLEAIKRHLCEVAKTTKCRNAAGLGALGYALSEGETSVIKDRVADKPIRIIASALERPDSFWEWISKGCNSSEQTAFCVRLQDYYKKSGWPWDKAFVLASGYLAFHEGIPTIEQTKTTIIEPFPFWVALDRHTPEGKRAFSEAAGKLGISAKCLGWVSFYCESSRTNNQIDSYWWQREKEWRLSSVGLSVTQAENLWAKASPLVHGLLQQEEVRLKIHIESAEELQPNLL